MGDTVSRPSYVNRASDNIDAAISKLGEVRAKGDQLKALVAVYELLVLAQDQVQLAIEAKSVA